MFVCSSYICIGMCFLFVTSWMYPDPSSELMYQSNADFSTSIWRLNALHEEISADNAYNAMYSHTHKHLFFRFNLIKNT